jgi:RNA polymerase sigma factor (sigma-70 family)
VPDRAAVLDAVRTLDARDRAIVLLHYGEDMTVAAVATALQIPSGTVKVKLQRIRAKLRVLLVP